jgi:hypothetical protein
MTYLDALRAIAAHAAEHNPPYRPVDADLNAAAGMDENLARMMQAARDMDRAAREASSQPPGSVLTGKGAPGRWFGFGLAFADDGPDLDTVTSTLRAMLPSGDPNGAAWVIHVEPASGAAMDVVPSHFEQDDDPARGWPVYLVGHRYDDDSENGRGAPVRVPIAGARITVY